MRIHFQPLQTIRATFLLGLIPCVGLAGGPALACPGVVTADHSGCDDWKHIVFALDVLATGTRDEKLSVFPEEPEDLFYPLDLPPDGDERLTREVVRKVRDYLAAERDTWVATRVAAALAWWGYEQATPVFLELAHHPAPSMRAQAVKHFAELDNDQGAGELWRMWKDERVPWVRAVLLEALDSVDLDADEECSRQLGSEDVELATTAIGCFPVLDDAGLAELIARAREGQTRIRQVAACELAAWCSLPTSPTVQDALEDLFRNAEPWMRNVLLEYMVQVGSGRALSEAKRLLRSADDADVLVAISALRHHDAPDVRALLRRRATTGSEGVQVAAIEALSRDRTEEDEDALFSRLDAPSLAVRMAAADALGAYRMTWTQTESGGFKATAKPMTDRVRSWLQGVAASDPDEYARERAQGLVDGQGRRWHPACLSCGDGGPVCGAWEPVELIAPPGADSLRCYATPGTEAPPERAIRTTAATASLEERFDDGREQWMRIDVAGGDGPTACWLPADRVRWAHPDAAAGPFARESRQEFDLPIATVESEAFDRLARARLVEAFDLGATLAGVRLTLDPEDAKAVETLREAVAAHWPGTRFEEAVKSLPDPGEN